jgi:hypothetical protein
MTDSKNTYNVAGQVVTDDATITPVPIAVPHAKISIGNSKEKSVNIGYKRLADDFIAKFEVRGRTNESRQVIDPNFAKYNCTEIHVLEIYNPFNGEGCTSAKSLDYPTFMYVVGKGVKSTAANIEEGIHYFKTELPAQFYTKCTTNYKQYQYTGSFTEFRDDGSIVVQGAYLNGNLHGEYKIYHSTSQNRHYTVKTYVNGMLNGPLTLFAEDGSIAKEGEYINDKKRGVWRELNECSSQIQDGHVIVTRQYEVTYITDLGKVIDLCTNTEKS